MASEAPQEYANVEPAPASAPAAGPVYGRGVACAQQALFFAKDDWPSVVLYIVNLLGFGFFLAGTINALVELDADPLLIGLCFVGAVGGLVSSTIELNASYVRHTIALLCATFFLCGIVGCVDLACAVLGTGYNPPFNTTFAIGSITMTVTQALTILASWFRKYRIDRAAGSPDADPQVMEAKCRNIIMISVMIAGVPTLVWLILVEVTTGYFF